jgi:dolichyl-phosphate beta-glucosyltransferase
MQKAGIVVPCYNESGRLDVSIFASFIQANPHLDFLFVNDGSKDDTKSVLEKLKNIVKDQVYIFELENNSGKAEAVRLGMIKLFSTNNYKYIGFWDADLATPLDEINELLNKSKNDAISILMGCRIKRLGTKVERKATRHFFGRIFSTFASIILKLPVYDTQCGAKLFRSDMDELFKEKFITKWLFDVELLARFRNTYGTDACLNNILEVPLNVWEDKGDSKLKFTHILKVPFELLKIRRKYNRG